MWLLCLCSVPSCRWPHGPRGPAEPQAEAASRRGPPAGQGAVPSRERRPLVASASTVRTPLLSLWVQLRDRRPSPPLHPWHLGGSHAAVTLSRRLSGRLVLTQTPWVLCGSASTLHPTALPQMRLGAPPAGWSLRRDPPPSQDPSVHLRREDERYLCAATWRIHDDIRESSSSPR